MIRKQKWFLGFFIASILSQLYYLWTIIEGGYFSFTVPASKFLIPFSILILMIDFYCANRLLRRSELKWYDIVALILTWMPFVFLISFFVFMTILFLNCSNCFS